ncbi:MAG TPA: SDR family oxidoreductase [Luteibacter sp.]|jgi:NAD(P)H dehydrogenase (quinone)|uniref:SDR family oxidoreductase n=1 Tax=Luteibacter sp. TaxID=1886636 RepID=UPI002F402BF5
MSIAVSGATGQLGRLVIEHLKKVAPATELIALARSVEKANDLGVPVRHFDYAAPDTLAPALKGVKRLLLISSDAVGQRIPQHRNVIEAAKQAGVTSIVYTSVLHADTSPLSLAAEHLETENLIKASGLSFTLLRNGWYTENYTGSVPAAVKNGVLAGSAGDGKISSAARIDYADAAAVVLATEGHADTTYELAGDTAYTLSDLAAEISRQTGKQIPYKNLPEAEYADVLLKAGLPPHWAHGLASFDVSASKGALFNEGRQLSRLIGRPTTPLAESVKEALAKI